MSFPDTDFNDIYYKIRFESLQGVFPSITVFCHFYQKNKYFGFKYLSVYDVSTVSRITIGCLRTVLL